MMCDNPKCRYHTPMPGNMPGDAPSVAIDAQTMGFSFKRLHIIRHLYRYPSGGEFYLCGECHAARQKGGAR